MFISTRGLVRTALASALSLCVLGLDATRGAEANTDDFETTLAAWRSTRLASLTSETGWLSLVGLDWLAPGENRFGTDSANAVVLPPGTGPAHAGAFILEQEALRVVVPEGSALTVNGKQVREAKLVSDEAGAPDEVRFGRVRMYVIRRGGKFAIRMKDPESPVRREFHGIDAYPADPAFRVEARFVPHATPREVEIPTVLGTTEKMTAPGILRFTLGGQELALEPLLEEAGATKLFVIFKDGTSGKTTYEAGRFLYTELPHDGRVMLDFNRAYNPPCAFTRFATCPLPPRKNWLPVAVTAGEKAYAHGTGGAAHM